MPLITCSWVAILTAFWIQPTPLAKVRIAALATLVQGYALRDVWTQSTARRTYNHYSMTGATRIDRFYVTPTLYRKKVAAEMAVAPFTDHHAVIL